MNSATNIAFPKESVLEKEGWKIHIEFTGIYTEFVHGVAQAGDPKGKVTLSGPKMKVVAGANAGVCTCCGARVKQLPVNLSQGRKLTRQLILKLRDEYNFEPNQQDILALGKEAFTPYDSYFD